MPQFNAVDSGRVILHRSGLYRQLKLYELDGILFAGNGQTFTRLNKGGATSTGAKWVHVSVDHIYNELGQLKIATQPKYEG